MINGKSREHPGGSGKDNGGKKGGGVDVEWGRGGYEVRVIVSDALTKTKYRSLLRDWEGEM